MTLIMETIPFPWTAVSNGGGRKRRRWRRRVEIILTQCFTFFRIGSPPPTSRATVIKKDQPGWMESDSRSTPGKNAAPINNPIKPVKHRWNKSIMDFYQRTNNICSIRALSTRIHSRVKSSLMVVVTKLIIRSSSSNFELLGNNT